MKKQNLRQLYSTLLIKKYNKEEFLLSIKNPESFFWKCCRDVAEETLLFSNNWNWLAQRIDDFAKIVELDYIAKLDKWKMKGSLSSVYHDKSFADVINWLFERYISMLKNLFNQRYKNSLDVSFHINIDDLEQSCIVDLQVADIYLDEFSSFKSSIKSKLLAKLWEENIYDSDFNLEDLRYLCEKYQAPPPETFLNLENVTKFEVKQNENGNSQLVFIFDQNP